MPIKKGVKHTPEFKAWVEMRRRCRATNRTGSKSYTNRGIHVCQRWGVFGNFLADVGLKPNDGKYHSLGRRDNDKGYWCGKSECPECGPLDREPNCRWENAFEQNGNRSNTKQYEYNGKTQCLARWSAECKIRYKTLQIRMQKGWTLEKAISTPITTAKIYKVDKDEGTLPKLSKKYGVQIGTVKARIRRGWSLKDALRKEV